MTEKKYIQSFVRSNGKWWLGALVAGLVIGFISANRLEPSYESSVSFTLTKNPASAQNTTDYYTYDGYYRDQASVIARNNLVAWVKSPTTVNAVYNDAQVTLPSNSTDGLSRSFKVNEATNSNVVDVNVTSSKEDEAKQLAGALVNVVKNGYGASDLTVSASSPLIVAVEPPKQIIMVGIALAITAAVFVITLINQYFKSED